MSVSPSGLQRCRLLAFCAVAGALLCPARSIAGSPVFLGPSPYLGQADRPFSTNGFLYFVIGTLEAGSTTFPGALVNTGWGVSLPGPLTDSVDEDDGAVDGSGTGGHSGTSSLLRSNLTVTFDPLVLGSSMPTHVGVVCTDIGTVDFGTPGYGDVTFTAHDTNGVFLGSITATNFGNGSAAGDSPGATAEDRFFGVIHAEGISSFSLTVNNSVDWEVDHIQYGWLDMPAVVPLLRIEFSEAHSARLAWATNAIGFRLEESPVLPAVNWSAVTSMPVVVGAEFQVTLNPSFSSRFYRLSLMPGSAARGRSVAQQHTPSGGWNPSLPGAPGSSR